MHITQKPLGEIHPYQNNPRKNAKAVNAVAESIKRYGFLVPIVLTADFLTFISFFTLHEAITPQRHHWYITSQCTYFGYNSISRTTIHNVIVYAIADFGTEGGFLFVVGIRCV